MAKDAFVKKQSHVLIGAGLTRLMAALLSGVTLVVRRSAQMKQFLLPIGIAAHKMLLALISRATPLFCRLAQNRRLPLVIGGSAAGTAVAVVLGVTFVLGGSASPQAVEAHRAPRHDNRFAFVTPHSPARSIAFAAKPVSLAPLPHVVTHKALHVAPAHAQKLKVLAHAKPAHNARPVSAAHTTANVAQPRRSVSMTNKTIWMRPVRLSRSHANAHAVKNRVVDAHFINSVQPDYSELALAEAAHGSAVVLVTIGAQGEVIGSVVNQSTGFPDLDNAALAAANASTFSPLMVDGKPTASTYRVVYNFNS